MAAVERRIGRLSLRASSAAQARRTAMHLEDALRTASLPGEAGGRLLLVRRLALGRLPADAGPTTLSLTLERAFAAVRPRCVHAATPGAAAAPAVWFGSALEAHVALALRLLAGPPPLEWFWPRAVPGWTPAAIGAEGLWHVVRSLARLPEATTAVPLWVQSLVEAGCAGPLLAALGAADRRWLCEIAGVPVAPASIAPHSGVAGTRTPAGARAGAGEVDSAAATEAAPSPRPAMSDAVFLRRMGTRKVPSLSPLPPEDGTGETAAVGAEATAAARGQVAGTPPHGRAPEAGEGGADVSVPAPSASPDPAARLAAGLAAADPPPAPASFALPADGIRGEVPAAAIGRAETALADADRGAPTRAGGLAFLLNALVRLGYPGWLERFPAWAGRDLARQVLGEVLGRLAVDAEDPAWRLARIDSRKGRAPDRFLAPAPWRPGLLAGRGPLRTASGPAGGVLLDASGRLVLGAWTGARPRELLPDIRRAAAVDAAVDAAPMPVERRACQAWVMALRRWLRRYAGIGLHDLVLRPARLHLSRTHLDLGFGLDGADLRIRRAGLDLDPGWLPWFGQVAGFRYRPGGEA